MNTTFKINCPHISPGQGRKASEQIPSHGPAGAGKAHSLVLSGFYKPIVFSWLENGERTIIDREGNEG